MSVRITVHQLQEQLPELLDRAVERGEVCIIERDGEEYAVLVSAREWRQRNPELDRSDPPADGAQDESDQDRRLREVAVELDALGPEYRLSPEKQARAEALLSKGNTLSRAERRELRALLNECDAIMLRRAEALDHVG
jgi:prevent-host-death family protein